MNKFFSNNDKKICIYLFCFSFLFFVFIGVLLTYNFDIAGNYNLLFDSDSSRVIGDITGIFYDHYRLKVHPLFLILVQPIYFILKGFFINNMLSLVFLSSIVSSLTVVLIYKILRLYSENKKICVLISLCYLFSFSNYVFTAGIEVYNFAVLFLVLSWYYALKKINQNNFSIFSNIIFSILGVLSLSFTITNGVVFLILLFALLVLKKIKFRNFVFVLLLTTAIFSIGVLFQNIVWHNTPVLNGDNFSEEKNYTEYKITFDKVKKVVKNDFYYSILGNNVDVVSVNGREYSGANYKLFFAQSNILELCFISIFYVLFLILLLRNIKYNFIVNIAFIIAFLYNSLLHVFYGNNSAFLYSLHFVYLIFLCFGLNLSSEKKGVLRNISVIYLLILLFLQMIFNNYFFIKIIRIVCGVLESNYFVKNFGIFKSTLILFALMAILILLVLLLYKLIIKFKKSENKEEKVCLVCSSLVILLVIQCFFIALETTPIYDMFFWKKIVVNHSEEISFNNIVSNEETLSDKYFDEMRDLEQYILEYNSLLDNYSNEKVNFLNDNSYYFFGFGNRKKIVFVDSKLIDIETKEVIYEFDLKSSLIIPNIYTVIIETKEGQFIKLYEDEKGVHFSSETDNYIIEGTDVFIDLYKFDNQKYKNIKRVLYGEILFNIKDSVIYPNILVYDKPWYRDAALGTMVLKQTGNLDLISDWVYNITDVYDRQNNGNSETDNLGELLYIISTQKNRNNKLINKIKSEAEKNANSNLYGDYLCGSTDFGKRCMYQNLWYRFGLESLNEKYEFSMPNDIDDYTSMVWWYDYDAIDGVDAVVDVNYPYLTYANFHNSGRGKIVVNNSLYPLSWEKNASQANYNEMDILGDYYVDNKISPLHVWSASEMLLFLLDETSNLK